MMHFTHYIFTKLYKGKVKHFTSIIIFREETKTYDKVSDGHDICPKIYTTRFSREKFYTAEVRNLQHCLVMHDIRA